jgi:hypothetical protein
MSRVPTNRGPVPRLALVLDVAAIVAAVAVVAFTPSPAWIELHYANGAYPDIDRAVRTITGPLPFCLGDVLFVIAVSWLVRYWIVAFRRSRDGWLRRLGRLALRTLGIACAIFVWFMFSWAYDYSRVPLADKIPVHNERTDEDSVGRFADRVNDELSRDADAGARRPAGRRRRSAQRLVAEVYRHDPSFGRSRRLRAATGQTDALSAV